MKIKSLFIVRDPSPLSVIEDIFFEASPESLADYIRGSTYAQSTETLTFYTEEPEALRDAKLRLARRDGVSRYRTEVCREFMQDMEPELLDGIVTEEILNALCLFEGGSVAGVTEREADEDLAIAIHAWLVADRTACIALLGPGLDMENPSGAPRIKDAR